MTIWWQFEKIRPGLGGDLGGTHSAGALRAVEVFTLLPPASPDAPANSQGDDVAARPGPSLSLDYREVAAWSLVGAILGFAAFVVWFIYVAVADFGFLNLFEP
jgi:hypothetical protein